MVYPLLQLKVIQLIKPLVAIAVPNTAAEGDPTDQAARRARTYAAEGHSRHGSRRAGAGGKNQNGDCSTTQALGMVSNHGRTNESTNRGRRHSKEENIMLYFSTKRLIIVTMIHTRIKIDAYDGNNIDAYNGPYYILGAVG